MSLLDKRLLAVPPEAVVARRAESCLAEHGAFDVCFQGVIEMLPKTDLIGESLKDLCAANARLLQDLALVARDGEKELLERLQVAEEKEKFHRLRADQADAETVELLGAARELEFEAIQHHTEMLELRRQLYTARHFFSQANQGGRGDHKQLTTTSSIIKKLSLQSLLDIIDQIRTSKAKADLNVRSTGMACETMEHHMYAFLRERQVNRSRNFQLALIMPLFLFRYGLKSLVVDHAASILIAAYKYSAISVEAAAFLLATYWVEYSENCHFHESFNKLISKPYNAYLRIR